MNYHHKDAYQDSFSFNQWRNGSSLFKNYIECSSIEWEVINITKRPGSAKQLIVYSIEILVN